MMTWCVRSILTVGNDERVWTHFGPVRLERMTSLITLMTCTSALVTRTFLWWHHRVIRIFVIRLAHLHTLCGLQKLVCREVYLLEILVPQYFMIGWWVVFCKIIRPVMYSLFPIGVWLAQFFTIFEPMVFHIPGFRTFWLNKQANDSNTYFSFRLKGFPLSGCGWSIVMRVFRIEAIFSLRNIPPVSKN